MVSRTISTHLILSLAFIATACAGDETAETSTTFGNEMGSETVGMEAEAEAEAMEAEMGDGDGDPTTGDGDGDPTTGDGDGDGDGDPTTGDGDGDGDGDPMECLDLDLDGYGENCDLGPDCDDADYNNHTVDGCANCMDADGDNSWVGCDTFDDNKPGPDCDDMDYNVFTQEGCDNCVDTDNDNAWVGCDQYGDEKPGPDCDDDNPVVGIGDEMEICNGLSENCAGEIDNAPPDDMCNFQHPNTPNVNPMNGWICDPPAPGVDGCVIGSCVEQFYDLDDDLDSGCECAGTPRTDSLAACSDAPQGDIGIPVLEGTQLNNLVLGTVPILDDGIGGGAEDWYWVEFPEAGNPGTRPETGSIQVSFAVNDNNDYRFQVFRACNANPFDNGLATQFGAGAPPTLQWWFFDNHAEPVDMPVPGLYSNAIAWPDKVYIRVFRVQNDQTCNTYRLSVQRIANGD
jgi:hypothetical protein